MYSTLFSATLAFALSLPLGLGSTLTCLEVFDPRQTEVIKDSVPHNQEFIALEARRAKVAAERTASLTENTVRVGFTRIKKINDSKGEMKHLVDAIVSHFKKEVQAQVDALQGQNQMAGGTSYFRFGTYNGITVSFDEKSEAVQVSAPTSVELERLMRICSSAVTQTIEWTRTHRFPAAESDPNISIAELLVKTTQLKRVDDLFQISTGNSLNHAVIYARFAEEFAPRQKSSKKRSSFLFGSHPVIRGKLTDQDATTRLINKNIAQDLNTFRELVGSLAVQGKNDNNPPFGLNLREWLTIDEGRVSPSLRLFALWRKTKGVEFVRQAAKEILEHPGVLQRDRDITALERRALRNVLKNLEKLFAIANRFTLDPKVDERLALPKHELGPDSSLISIDFKDAGAMNVQEIFHTLIDFTEAKGADPFDFSSANPIAVADMRALVSQLDLAVDRVTQKMKDLRSELEKILGQVFEKSADAEKLIKLLGTGDDLYASLKEAITQKAVDQLLGTLIARGLTDRVRIVFPASNFYQNLLDVPQKIRRAPFKFRQVGSDQPDLPHPPRTVSAGRYPMVVQGEKLLKAVEAELRKLHLVNVASVVTVIPVLDQPSQALTPPPDSSASSEQRKDAGVDHDRLAFYIFLTQSRAWNPLHKTAIRNTIVDELNKLNESNDLKKTDNRDPSYFIRWGELSDGPVLQAVQ